jgi:hypothetical protein
MSLERQTDSNVSIRQYESVRSVLCKIDDPRLTHAKSGCRLHLRQPLVTAGISHSRASSIVQIRWAGSLI